MDHLMKYMDQSHTSVAQMNVYQLVALTKPHQEYMQKYKPKLEKMEQTCTVPQLKDSIHDIILILEGKRYVNASGVFIPNAEYMFMYLTNCVLLQITKDIQSTYVPLGSCLTAHSKSR